MLFEVVTINIEPVLYLNCDTVNIEADWYLSGDIGNIELVCHIFVDTYPYTCLIFIWHFGETLSLLFNYNANFINTFQGKNHMNKEDTLDVLQMAKPHPNI